MKIGYLSDAYAPVTAAEPEWAAGYAAMRSHGFDCADYQNFIRTDNALFALSDAAFEARLRAERAAADAAGIAFYQVHGPWRYPPQDDTPERRAERREKMERSLWGASLLGAACMVIHPVMPFGVDCADRAAEMEEANRAFLGDLLPAAHRYGVTLALENMPFRDLPLARPAECLALIRSVGDDRLRLCLDTGHAVCCQVSPAAALREAGDAVVALHVHDNDGWNDFHWQPYTGVIDWADFTAALHEVDFSGAVSLELHGGGHYPPALDAYFRAGLARIARHIAGEAVE